MSNILKSSEKTFDKQMDLKLKLENEILFNLQECFLNDKAVETMANSIKKMREKSRKQVSAFNYNSYLNIFYYIYIYILFKNRKCL